MRSAGIYMIISAIVIFIITGIIEITVEPTNLKHLMYLTWLKGFSQILVISGIGFILFDIAAKHGIKEQPKSQENRTKDSAELKEGIMECPRCDRQTKFPISKIDSTVECPYCKLKVDLEGIQEKSKEDEEDKNE